MSKIFILSAGTSPDSYNNQLAKYLSNYFQNNGIENFLFDNLYSDIPFLLDTYDDVPNKILEMRKLLEQKKYLSNLLNNRSLLLETLIEELKHLKKKFNVKRKTKILKDINQEEEIDTINNQILEDLINKETKISVDNRFYFKKIIYSNSKKLLDHENRFIDNKNIHKFICKIYKSLKIIGITSSGKILQIDWKSNCLLYTSDAADE